MIVRELITKLGFQVDKAGIGKAEAAYNQFKAKVQDKVGDIQGAIQAGMSGDLTSLLSMSSKMLPIAAAAAAAFALYKVGSAAVSAASEVEDLTTQFEVMLGSADQAGVFVEKIRAMAAATPFGTSDLAQAAVTLKQFGVATDAVLPTLKMLGDVSGGNSQRMKSLALVFGQVQSTGRLMGQDLLQLINVGFNPLQVLAKESGKSMKQMKDRMEAGKVSAEDVARAFKIATSQGGMFFKGMEKASKTFSGLMSTLQDDWKAWLAEIGKPMLVPLKDMTRELSGLIQSPAMKLLGDSLSALLTTLLYIGKAVMFGLKVTFAPLQWAVKQVYFLVDILKRAFGPLAASIMRMIAPIQKALNGLFKGDEDGANMLERLMKFANFLGDVLLGIINTVSTAVGMVLELLTPVFQTVADGITAFANTIHTVWNDVFGGMINGIFKFVETTVNLLNKIPGVKLDVQGLDDMKKQIEAFVLFDKKVTQDMEREKSAKSTAITVNNDISITGDLSTGAGMKGTIKEAAQAAFSLELKKLLIASL